jgi:hypothetical protein
MESIFVKPADGMMVRNPETNLFLAPEGEMVPRDSFWLRRIADGSVTLADAPAAEQAAPVKTNAAKAK